MTDTAAPVVTDEMQEHWGVYDTETERALLTDRSRAEAERRLEHLAKKNPNVTLVRRMVRVRTEKWHDEIEVIPWHTRCNWIAQGDNDGRQVGDAWCFAHKHSEGTPVPPEHIRGAVNAT